MCRTTPIWSQDGEIQESVSYIDEVWSGGESGSWWVCMPNENGLPDGMLDLTLNVEGQLISGWLRRRRGGPRAVTHIGINNDGPETVCYLQISPTTSTFWGADWLADQILAPDDRLPSHLPPYTYDLRGLDCDLNELFVDQQDITADRPR